MVETRVETVNNSLTGRIAALERNAFSVKPSLTLGYSVSRANRNFDIDRLFPLNADGTVANNAFTSGGIDSDTGAQRRDFGDFGNTSSPIVAGANGLYGFAAAAGPVYQEGSTDIGISLGFDTSGQFSQVTSAASGSLFNTAGRLSINSIDLNFGLTTRLPDDVCYDANGDGSCSDAETAAVDVLYPGARSSALIDPAGSVYRPVFFRFKNATTEFSVGNNPVIVTLGRKQKFYFADYAFDNNYDGRGDGFVVSVDGSNLPVLGALKPKITTVYGSRGGDNVATSGNYGVYYRGVRAQITPVGTLNAGLYYAQEGRDAFGAAAAAGQTAATVAAVPNDVTLYGADLHGKAFGVELHSEYTASRVTPVNSAAYTASAFYARAATRKTDLTYDLNTPAARLGTDTFNVSLYDLNYRRIEAGVTEVSGISEYGYDTRRSYSSTRQNNADNPNNGVTAPFSNLYGRTATGSTTNDGLIGQKGFGVKAAVTLGPVSVGGYYDSSTSANGSMAVNDPNLLIERGASAKVAASIFSLRGSYNELLSNRYQTYRNAGTDVALGATVTDSVYARRYAIQADVTPGLGLYVGAYYRDVSVDDQAGGMRRSSTDRGLFGRGYLASSFAPGVGANSYRAGLTCSESNFGTSVAVNGVSGDTDGVGGVLNPAVNLDANRTGVCFTSYGVEAGHAGNNANALVKDLFFRVGYGRVYVPTSNTSTTGDFSGNIFYGDVRYDRKVSAANVRLAGSFSNSNVRLDARPAGTRGAIGLIVRTDPLTGLPFSPQINGQVGYYTSQFDNDSSAATPALNANAVKYGAGIVLNDFLLPNTKVGVRYDGYSGINRAYTPYDGAGTEGYFADADTNGNRINLNGVYVEGAYNDLVFSYGNYTLSSRNNAGTEIGSGLNNGQPARGQTFKITYKVNF